MFRTILIFGGSLALLLVMLKWLEYSFFVKDLTLETYLGVVGTVFLVVGIWVGWKLTTRRKLVSEGNSLNKLEVNPGSIYEAGNKFNLSPREHEVLVLIAQGLSYQEIAEKMFVSLSTIKTHAANIFSKMNVQRRTQAVMMAQKNGLLPPLKV